MKNKLFGLSAILLALGMVACGETKTTNYQSDKTNHWVEGAEDAKEKHTFEVSDSKSKAATCKEKGTKVEVCSVCGYEKSSEIKTLAHDYEVDASASKAATCAEAGEKVEKCKACGDVKRTPITKLNHDYVAKSDATHATVAATCSVEGVHYEQCKLCNEWNEVKDGYADHTWGEYSNLDGNANYKKRTCTVCGATDIYVNALGYTTISGTNKDTTGATLKLGKNNDNTVYNFNMPGNFTGKVYLYGWVDRFAGSDNNGEKGFFTGKNGGSSATTIDHANFSLSINDTAVEVTNQKTYVEMGMKASGISVGDDGTTTASSTYERSTEALCEVGAVTVASGATTVKYSRVDSYNLNISEIHFIGTFAA